jgi:DNA primase
MPRYTSESREKIRDAIDFVELVGARTELRRAGQQRYTGLCPFHEERSPSFGINPVEKLYYCFGCGEGGDLFKFVMETEGLDFGAALESLADRAGIQLERETEDPRDAERRERRERLFALLERTAAFYVRMLWESDEAAMAREYLVEKRGLSESVLRQFRVGYAPSAWDKVLTASRRSGYSEEELRAAGLAARSNKGAIYDRFRSRIMFPLCDMRGRVLGFGARALRDNQQPKYLNSSDGEVYSKGQYVYGGDLARTTAARASRSVLVEGYTDVIALHQAGMENAVGLMGTALAEGQVKELARLAPTVLFCLDADTAGREAIMRAAQLVNARNGELLVVPLPVGSDPADIVQRDGADEMKALLERAVPFARFEVERTLERGDVTSSAGRDRALGEVAEVIRPLPAGILRGEVIQLVSDRLGITPELVETAVSSAPRRVVPASGRPAAAATTDGAHQALDRREQTERAFLALCLALPEQGERKLAEADFDALFTSPLTRRAAERLQGRLETPSVVIAEDPELATLVAELVIRAGQLDATPATLDLEALQLDLHRLDREITAARTADGSLVQGLAEERQRILDLIRHRLQ